MLQTGSRAPSSLKSKYLQKFDGITLRNVSDSSDDDGNDEPMFTIDSRPCVEPEVSKVRRTTKERIKLASELSPVLSDTYVAVRAAEQATMASEKIKELVLQSSADSMLQGSVLTPGFEKKDSVPPYSESLRRIRAQRKEERGKTKGPGWFGLPAPEMTEELKRDLEVLRMRHVLDPKRFYKKNDLKDLPKYFQMGTVMDSAADFYHARVPKKDRKQTMVDELLADAEFRRFNKKKFNEFMAQQQRGASRKALMHMKRMKKRKT
ncbi:deoxynucleotidyltransferase terminal-interacting protein 2 [Amblyomma americanum]